MKSHEFLTSRLLTIAKLEKLKKDVDPASGMSICVRRGVLSDANEDDNDLARREWISLEIGENMEKIIDLLIEEQQKSAKLWAKSVQDDIAAAQKALHDAGI